MSLSEFDWVNSSLVRPVDLPCPSSSHVLPGGTIRTPPTRYRQVQAELKLSRCLGTLHYTTPHSPVVVEMENGEFPLHPL